MDFITIQRLIEKLQAHEEKVNHIQVDLRAQSFFPNTIQKRSKMVWDISKKVDDVDKAEKEEEEVDFENEAEATLTS